MCTSPWESQAGTRWDAKNWGTPWGSSAGTLGPKSGWLWRPTLLRYENGYVLICIFTSFLIQRILKLWWSWTYQNSAVKRASAREVQRWVTHWKIWLKRTKSGQYCIIGGESLHPSSSLEAPILLEFTLTLSMSSFEAFYLLFYTSTQLS